MMEESSILNSSDFENLIKIVSDADKILNRIGFDKQTKISYLKEFFNNAEDLFKKMFEQIENLEEQKRVKIEEYRKNIRLICCELDIQYDDKSTIDFSILEQEKILNECYENLKNVKIKRLDDYESLLSKERELCIELTQRKTSFKSKIPTIDDIDDLKKRIDSLENVKFKRINELTKYRNDINELNSKLNVQELDYFTANLLTRHIHELPLSDNYLNEVKEKRDQLKVKYENLILNLKSLVNKIKQLWSKLEIDYNDELKIIIECNDLDTKFDNYDKYKLLIKLNDEYQRCVQFKLSNIPKFIEKIRVDITCLFEKLYYSDAEAKNFECFLTTNNYNEDLLKLHEDKLDELQLKLNENLVIYEKTAKLISTWEQFEIFSEQTKDPSRFKLRGYNGAEEEKKRKEFKSQLAKLDDELKKLTDEFRNKNNNEIFKIKGQIWNVYIDNLKKHKSKKIIIIDKKENSVATKSLSRSSSFKTNKNDITRTKSPQPAGGVATPNAARRQLLSLNLNETNKQTSTRKSTKSSFLNETIFKKFKK